MDHQLAGNASNAGIATLSGNRTNGTITTPAHRHRHNLANAAAALAFTALLIGCTPAGTGTTPQPARPATATHAAAPGEYQLIQEPEDGYQPIYQLITSATSSIDVTMYELADPTAEADLIAAHRRHVAVRILLDRAYTGGRINRPAYQRLHAAGVAVRWAPRSTIYHQKTITADRRVSAVGTANLTARYYKTSRDAWIIDRNPAHVQAIDATFDADYAGGHRTSSDTHQASGLLWSPGARAGFVALIQAARDSIDFESEELSSPDVIAALAAAARRHVACDIVMTASPSWDRAYAALTRAGCHVRTYPDTRTALYIHEKLLRIDRKTLTVGSQNAGTGSLTYNRELAVSITTRALVAAAGRTFARDFAAGRPWAAQR